MRRNLLRVFLFWMAAYAVIFPQNFALKSLRVFPASNELSFPVINMQAPTGELITIEFDIDAAYEPNLSIVFKFCNSNWQPYDNAFLSNPGYNTQHNLWFERLPLKVRGASYHYSGKFPNDFVTFPFPGKWKFYIVDSQNSRHVYGEGKFYVVEQQVKINAAVSREREIYSSNEAASLGRTISINTSFILPDSLVQSNLKMIEIIENRKLEYPIQITRNDNSTKKYYEWNGSNRFNFVARELKPGNEYRQTDIRDANKFIPPNVNAQFDGIETSNFFRKQKRDWNGASLISNYRNENSEYLNVNFRIRPPEEITSPVFLVGSFNNWIVSPEYEMFDDKGLLNLSVELKRGVYEYQYVTGDFSNGSIENIDWYILEGNFWETENEYNIFLYYESTEKGGYDKIIGYRQIKTGAL